MPVRTVVDLSGPRRRRPPDRSGCRTDVGARESSSRHPRSKTNLMRSGGAVLHSRPTSTRPGSTGRPLTRLVVLAMIKTRGGTLVSAPGAVTRATGFTGQSGEPDERAPQQTAAGAAAIGWGFASRSPSCVCSADFPPLRACPWMTDPSVVAVARIGLELARRTWPLVLRALTTEDRSLNPADLLCCVIVFGHGAGVPYR